VGIFSEQVWVLSSERHQRLSAGEADLLDPCATAILASRLISSKVSSSSRCMNVKSLPKIAYGLQ